MIVGGIELVFKCKNCRGQVTYNPDKGSMVCENCDSVESQDIITSETPSICPGCGTSVEPGEYTSATRCPSCGTYLILDDKVRYPYGANVVIPFKLSKDKAADILVERFKKSLFLPNDFLSRKTLEKLAGAYVPFWLYDFDTDVDYSATGTKVKSWTTGNRRYTETSYYNIHRRLNIDYKGIPVDASKAMDDEVMDLMEPYDYKLLNEYDDKFLSGFYSEVYNFTPDELTPRAEKKANKSSDAWIRSEVSGYNTLTNIRKNVANKRTGNEYALLPVWKYVYRYNNKNYAFYVNGQTGKTYGSLPICKWKLITYSSMVFALSTGLLFALEQLLEVL